ncbi:hypothetical protein GCM10009101_16940 [Brevundimonas lenta]
MSVGWRKESGNSQQIHLPIAPEAMGRTDRVSGQEGATPAGVVGALITCAGDAPSTIPAKSPEWSPSPSAMGR